MMQLTADFNKYCGYVAKDEPNRLKCFPRDTAQTLSEQLKQAITNELAKDDWREWIQGAPETLIVFGVTFGVIDGNPEDAEELPPAEEEEEIPLEEQEELEPLEEEIEPEQEQEANREIEHVEFTGHGVIVFECVRNQNLGALIIDVVNAHADLSCDQFVINFTNEVAPTAAPQTKAPISAPKAQSKPQPQAHTNGARPTWEQMKVRLAKDLKHTGARKNFMDENNIQHENGDTDRKLAYRIKDWCEGK